MPSPPSQQFLTYSSLHFVWYWQKLLVFKLPKINPAIFTKVHISVFTYLINFLAPKGTPMFKLNFELVPLSSLLCRRDRSSALLYA